MTEGAPWRRIAEFAIPMLLGNLAQQLYNTVDSIVVGKYVGDNALAAVGTSMPILNLLLAVFVGVATGAGIVISQHYGAGNRLALSRAIGNCLTLAAIASVATMILGTIITRPLLRLLSLLGGAIARLVETITAGAIFGAVDLLYYRARKTVTPSHNEDFAGYTKERKHTIIQQSFSSDLLCAALGMAVFIILILVVV